MMIRMARSLFTLHELSIIHTDLKLDNFLMENKYYPVLSDFGFSFNKTKFDSGEIIIDSVSGTENYFAPELMKRD
jgi:serine/threonine protein kinase